MLSKKLFIGSMVVLTVLVLITLILSIMLISRKACAPVMTTVQATSASPISSTPIPQNGPWTVLRLPTTVVPLQYSIHMNPHIEDGWFEGFETITVQISKATNVFYLHIEGLNINSTQITPHNFPSYPYNIVQQFYYAPNNFWVIMLQDTVPPGLYRLSLYFSGSLTKNIVGFYRSVYTNRVTGKQSFLVTTKFEPTFARRAFPCFDEPNKKATYQMNLYHDPIKYPTALSNTMAIFSGIAQTGPFKNSWLTAFSSTSPMSTYLVCFIVSDFVQQNTTTNHNVLVRTFAPSDRIKETSYALQVASKTLDFYDDYFGISYNKSFSKLDLVSIPDFISGAMENWGIVTFRETKILYMDGIYSAYSKFRVADVVCHELAHMWFGNLVTMDWWSDLWLNEGFATFMAYVKGVPNIEPTWQSDTVYILNELVDALSLDSALSSHPIIQNISKPSDINSAFDSITYSKGSAILRMLEDTLTPAVFKQGITNYLNAFAYQNAKTDDLWMQLKNVSGMDVKGLMDTWTLRMGYPVITYDPNRDQLRQTRFSSNSAVNVTPTVWDVPIKWIDDENITSFLRVMNTSSLKLPSLINHQWIKLNPNSKGYFRVNYDSSTWSKLAAAMKNNTGVLTASDRTGLLDNSFKLAAADQLDYSVPLSTIGYMATETSATPLTVAFDSLNYVATMMRSNATAFAKLQGYVSSLSGPLLQRVGWNLSPTVDFNRDNLQSLMVSESCRFGSQSCLNQSYAIFQAWLQGTSVQIPANYRSSVLKYGIQQVSGSQISAVWNTVFSRYVTATTDQQTDLRYCLAQTTNTTILQKYLSLGNNQSVIRDQDYWSFLRYIAANPAAGDMAFDWCPPIFNDL